MNREIKFRVWDRKNKAMYHQDGIVIFVFPDEFYHIENLDGKVVVQPEHVSLMQFTGLKDKNGTPIYEGDICELYQGVDGNGILIFPFNKFVVKYDNETGSFNIHQKRDQNWGMSGSFYAEIVVIGNIFENPELIEDKK